MLNIPLKCLFIKINCKIEIQMLSLYLMDISITELVNVVFEFWGLWIDRFFYCCHFTIKFTFICLRNCLLYIWRHRIRWQILIIIIIFSFVNYSLYWMQLELITKRYTQYYRQIKCFHFYSNLLRIIIIIFIKKLNNIKN